MSDKLVITPILISLPVRRVLLIGGYMKQEITIQIKTENGETLDMRDIVKLFFESDEGVETVRAILRTELMTMLGGYDERH